jgi:hypothetical protein
VNALIDVHHELSKIGREEISVESHDKKRAPPGQV